MSERQKPVLVEETTESIDAPHNYVSRDRKTSIIDGTIMFFSTEWGKFTKDGHDSFGWVTISDETSGQRIHSLIKQIVDQEKYSEKTNGEVEVVLEARGWRHVYAFLGALDRAKSKLNAEDIIGQKNKIIRNVKLMEGENRQGETVQFERYTYGIKVYLKIRA